MKSLLSFVILVIVCKKNFIIFPFNLLCFLGPLYWGPGPCTQDGDCTVDLNRLPDSLSLEIAIKNRS